MLYGSPGQHANNYPEMGPTPRVHVPYTLPAGATQIPPPFYPGRGTVSDISLLPDLAQRWTAPNPSYDTFAHTAYASTGPARSASTYQPTATWADNGETIPPHEAQFTATIGQNDPTSEYIWDAQWPYPPT